MKLDVYHGTVHVTITREIRDRVVRFIQVHEDGHAEMYIRASDLLGDLLTPDENDYYIEYLPELDHHRRNDNE